MQCIKQTYVFMKTPVLKPIRLSASVVRELEEVETLEFSLNLDELLEWVNLVVARFAPEVEQAGSGRVSPAFTPRSFRHYQTLGCIDSPAKVGKGARYGFRHYLQALLIRKLLWERMPAERISGLLDSRTNAEYKELLFGGVEWVATPAIRSVSSAVKVTPAAATWTRVSIAPGVEIQLREHSRRPNPAELTEWLRAIEQAIRKNLC